MRREGRFGIVDIGSHSARIVVYEQETAEHLRIVASARASLRLVEAVEATQSHTLGAETLAKVSAALRDFRAIASGAGAKTVHAFATAAVRDTRNVARFESTVARGLGVPVRVLSAQEEARFGFLGALRGLHEAKGYLFDLGGGSLQVTKFQDRSPRRSWSAPLGALRLALRFLEHDPPTEKEVRHLRRHAQKFLEELKLPSLGEKGALVGTGGTLRNLAKIDGFRAHGNVPRIHGYRLSLERLREIEEDLVSQSRARVARIVGLSKDRVDSIVAGAVVIRELCDAVGAEEIVVSGQGLREGLAYSAIGLEILDIDTVRQQSVTGVVSRFRTADLATGLQRASIATALLSRLMRGPSRTALLFPLATAAQLLDIGRAVDFFDRHEHAARLVLDSEMEGFSTKDTARVAAVLHAADEEGISLASYAPHVRRAEFLAFERAAVALLVADALLERTPRGSTPRVNVLLTRARVIVHAKRVLAWRSRGLAERFARAFGKELVVETRP